MSQDESFIPCFDTERQAHSYFREITSSLQYVDNWRYAYVGNEMQEFYYEESRNKGCCGFIDIKVRIGKNEFLMGCNYGH